MNKKIIKLVDSVKKEIDSGKEFAFFKFIDELDPAFEDLVREIDGIVEENVVIKGKVFLGKNSLIKSGTYIEGNTFIGENCVVGPNAYLRHNVVIGDNCHIANSEIKNSIILSHSNVPHFSYVGDSVLGENINLGAGTKIANLRHDNKNIQLEVNNKKIDSGRRKLGALIGSGTKIGVNASINCGVIVGNNCKIFPGVFVKENLKSGETAK